MPGVFECVCVWVNYGYRCVDLPLCIQIMYVWVCFHLAVVSFSLHINIVWVVKHHEDFWDSTKAFWNTTCFITWMTYGRLVSYNKTGHYLALVFKDCARRNSSQQRLRTVVVSVNQSVIQPKPKTYSPLAFSTNIKASLFYYYNSIPHEHITHSWIPLVHSYSLGIMRKCNININ